MEKQQIGKSEVREIYKKKRLELDANFVKSHSQQIEKTFFEYMPKLFGNFSHLKIAFYFPINNEVDVEYIIKKIWEKYPKIKTLMPFITGKYLSFREYKEDSDLTYNTQYPNIKEVSNGEEIVPDIIIAPLVAFDKSMNRIGMGGGFYDRSIDFLRSGGYNVLFGAVAFNLQEYSTIPVDGRDEKLDLLITETYLINK